MTWGLTTRTLYELIQDLSLPASAAPLPDEVRHLLGWQKQDTMPPGAYPRYRTA